MQNIFTFLVTSIVLVLIGTVAAQNASPENPAPQAPTPAKTITLGELVDSLSRQERRLGNLMRNLRPLVETYVQEEKPDPVLTNSPKDDDYFLSRLDVTGKTASALAFTGEEHGKNSDTKLPKDAEAFAAGGFAQALFPDPASRLFHLLCSPLISPPLPHLKNSATATSLLTALYTSNNWRKPTPF